jgi:hypothetical protein
MTNHEADRDGGGLLALVLLALLAGAVAGLVGAVFRLFLFQADRLREALIGWAHGWETTGLLLVLALCSAATALAAWLVRRFSPHAAGSGFPHVEAVRGRQPANAGAAKRPPGVPAAYDSGDAITQSVLPGDVSLATIPAAFAVRFVVGAVEESRHADDRKPLRLNIQMGEQRPAERSSCAPVPSARPSGF